MDFTNFVITQPSNDITSVGLIQKGSGFTDPGGVVANSYPVNRVTQCLEDSFSVSSPGNSAPPTICGTNTGQHSEYFLIPSFRIYNLSFYQPIYNEIIWIIDFFSVYVEVNNCDCNVLSMNIGTAAGTRSWNIKVTQYDCTFENLAPDGCNKYFFGAAAHLLQTYNFAGNLHLANQRDKFCIRRERNNCQICYTTMINTDFQVSNGGASFWRQQQLLWLWSPNIHQISGNWWRFWLFTHSWSFNSQ